jgi:hypothetical protein
MKAVCFYGKEDVRTETVRIHRILKSARRDRPNITSTAILRI